MSFMRSTDGIREAGKFRGSSAAFWTGQGNSRALQSCTGPGREGFCYLQDTADLGCIQHYYFYCTCLAWGCQCCCTVDVGVTPLQVLLSLGKVRWGPGVKGGGFTPRRATRGRRLLDLALDKEGFCLVRLGWCAHVVDMALPSVFLFIA